jgi:hypothetical protein
MVMVLWFYGYGLKPWKKHGEMVPPVCLPIKPSGNHVLDRKCVAFIGLRSVKTI